MRIKEFLNDFKNDLRKIIYPKRKDVIYFSILTVVLAFLFACFFMLTDKIASSTVNYLLGA